MAKKKEGAADEGGSDAAPVEKKGAPSFDWAVNQTKLKAAIKHVAETQPTLKAGTQDHHDAVLERYTQLKGLVRGARGAATGKKGGAVQNMSDHDGSSDTAEDENDGE